MSWSKSHCPPAELPSPLIEACFARIVEQAWILPMRHTRHDIDYGPQLGGVTLARCGWMDFRKLWLRPTGNV
ncbi:hypothetical protein ACO0LF_26890 [Undibacterium sp. Di27W]|uniref:hypothetical protein n=1 Tax=Undibacterium sp. Di27W TaxID=3413036 RepID=UPI003BF0B578